MINNTQILTGLCLTTITVLFVGICVLCAHTGSQVDVNTFIGQFN